MDDAGNPRPRRSTHDRLGAAHVYVEQRDRINRHAGDGHGRFSFSKEKEDITAMLASLKKNL